LDKVREFERKALEIKELLKNPFKTGDLEHKLEALLELMRSMKKEELVKVKPLYEEIKHLLNRNIDIIAGAVKPFLKLNRGVISRRV
jgi:hypothetical protein